MPAGGPHGWTQPGALAAIGNALFAAFQNGVGSMGEPSPAGGTQSTMVKFDLAGDVLGSWNITGKVDGLGIDPKTRQAIATVDEDGS